MSSGFRFTQHLAGASRSTAGRRPGRIRYSPLMKFYVYILYAPSIDRFYVGQTEDIPKRIAEHKVRKNLGASDWELKYSEVFATRSESVLRESEIKAKKRRTYIEWLIGSPQ